MIDIKLRNVKVEDACRHSCRQIVYVLNYAKSTDLVDYYFFLGLDFIVDRNGGVS